MPRWLGLVGAAVLAVAVVAFGLVGYRAMMRWTGRTPEGYQILTAVPGASGFEPAKLPAGPVLESQSSRDLALNFGYRVAGVAHAYSLVLDFPRDAEEGHATLVARIGRRSLTCESGAVRHFDEPRHAYAVALAGSFKGFPREGAAVPALCVKAVIGASKADYDLADASICVAQRDAAGECHPETLACGLIRP